MNRVSEHLRKHHNIREKSNRTQILYDRESGKHYKQLNRIIEDLKKEWGHQFTDEDRFETVEPAKKIAEYKRTLDTILSLIPQKGWAKAQPVFEPADYLPERLLIYAETPVSEKKRSWWEASFMYTKEADGWVLDSASFNLIKFKKDNEGRDPQAYITFSHLLNGTPRLLYKDLKTSYEVTYPVPDEFRGIPSLSSSNMRRTMPVFTGMTIST